MGSAPRGCDIEMKTAAGAFHRLESEEHPGAAKHHGLAAVRQPAHLEAAFHGKHHPKQRANQWGTA